MTKFLSSALRIFTRLIRALWRGFRLLPLLLQWLIIGGAVGATLVGVFVGNMGLALMGTAIGISGVLAGAVIGSLAVFVPWAGTVLAKDKYKK